LGANLIQHFVNLKGMIGTILLLILVLIFFTVQIIGIIRRKNINKTKYILFSIIGNLIIITLIYLNGVNKIKSDLSRLIENSSPKKAEEVYTLLFKKPNNDCLRVINYKDQVIPKIDCCIWMEVNLCPTELRRIINSKNYSIFKFKKVDSVNFLASFSDRPIWWTPQDLGSELFKLNFRFDKDNEQSLFFGKDSSHVYLCDQAL
jgi:hypothetical protein